MAVVSALAQPCLATRYTTTAKSLPSTLESSMAHRSSVESKFSLVLDSVETFATLPLLVTESQL
jgi:hypothetical protein